MRVVVVVVLSVLLLISVVTLHRLNLPPAPLPCTLTRVSKLNALFRNLSSSCHSTSLFVCNEHFRKQRANFAVAWEPMFESYRLGKGTRRHVELGSALLSNQTSDVSLFGLQQRFQITRGTHACQINVRFAFSQPTSKTFAVLKLELFDANKRSVGEVVLPLVAQTNAAQQDWNVLSKDFTCAGSASGVVAVVLQAADATLMKIELLNVRAASGGGRGVVQLAPTAEVRGKIEVRTFRGSFRAQRDDVTALLIADSLQSFDRVMEFVDKWKGPASVSVFIQRRSVEDMFDIARRKSPELMQWADVHFVTIRAESVPQMRTPVAALRNIARARARTDVVMEVDSACLPSVDAHDIVLAASQKEMLPSALFIPGFSPHPHVPRLHFSPRTMERLQERLDGGHYFTHAVSDYNEWIRAQQSFCTDINDQSLESGAIVMSKSQLPPWEERTWWLPREAWIARHAAMLERNITFRAVAGAFVVCRK